jgi:hypothetical protein
MPRSRTWPAWPGRLGRDAALDVGYTAARALLVNPVTGGTLADASQAAYQEGLVSLIRVGPLGGLPGAAKLDRIRFLDPADRQDGLRVTLRWEAIGVTGGLFPVLDGDFTLTPAGEDAVRLALAGVYRPPGRRSSAGCRHCQPRSRARHDNTASHGGPHPVQVARLARSADRAARATRSLEPSSRHDVA